MPKKPKILIIEDDPFLSSMYVTKLEKYGFETEAEESGKPGLARAQEMKPDLILLDILLPEMSGFEILKKLKEDPKTKDIPVILLTNLGQKQDVEEGLKLGAVDYLIKAQFTPAQVIEKIEKALKHT